MLQCSFAVSRRVMKCPTAVTNPTSAVPGPQKELARASLAPLAAAGQASGDGVAGNPGGPWPMGTGAALDARTGSAQLHHWSKQAQRRTTQRLHMQDPARMRACEPVNTSAQTSLAASALGTMHSYIIAREL